jgi:predicted acyltransferase
MEASVKKSERLMSIDALRGFDMLMIIFADRFFFALDEGAHSPLTGFMATQFDHPAWFGFHFYDIIMPLFLFIVGAVIPFSMGKRLREAPTKASLYPHLFRRFVLLFILGWIVQGNILAFDSNKFQIFSNTLQAIAVGYFFSVVAYIHLKRNGRYILFGLCLVVYALLLTLPHVPGVGGSELLPDKNFALYVDHLVFGLFDDGLQYTWLLSALGFTATTLSGLFAGEILQSSFLPKKRLVYLIGFGILGVVSGLILGIWHPIVKKIWTSSFVLFQSGIAFLLLALFYWLIDVKQYKKWAFPLKVIGMNAITAYVMSHLFDMSQISSHLVFGLEQYVGGYFALTKAIAGFLIFYLFLWYLYKNKTFIKI